MKLNDVYKLKQFDVNKLVFAKYGCFASI